MPTTSRHVTIMGLVATRLAGINGTGAYNTNLTSKIHEWRERVFEEGNLPALTYRDVGEETEREDFHDVHKLKVEIAVGAKGASSLATIRNILTDIRTAIKSDLYWSSNAHNTEEAGVDMEFSDETESEATIARFNIVITYRTLPFEPT